MANDWQEIGFILALVIIFATGLAWVTRKFSNNKLEGQTYWLVVVGVAGVVLISGLRIGWEAVSFLLGCFAVSAVPMGVEFYGRYLEGQKKLRAANEAMAEKASNTDGYPSADREE